MTLARNPKMPYIAAGRQQMPGSRLNVRSNVYVPDSNTRENGDERTVYSAPAYVRRQPITISFKTLLMAVACAVFAMAMLYVFAVARRAGYNKDRLEIIRQTQTYIQEAARLRETKEQMSSSAELEMKAANDLQMLYIKGVKPVYITAPDTRPAQAEPSLPAELSRASLEP